MNNIHTIAVDIGSGYTKYIDLPSSGEVSDMRNAVMSFKTAVGPSRSITIQPGVKPLIVEFEDKSFFVGQTAENALSPEHRVNTLSPEWAFEDGHRALIFYVIARALTAKNVQPSDQPIPVRLITGLPQAYYESGAEKCVNLLQGVHRFRHAGCTWVIELLDVQVIPQAMGAYYTAIETLLTPEEASERVGLIDIGTYTTDFCLSEDVQYHAYESGGVAIGVSSLISQLRVVLERDLGFSYSEDSIKKAFDRKQVLVCGESRDVSSQVQEVIGQIGKQLEKSLPDSWDTNAMYLVLAGGGGQLSFFGSYLKSIYKHIKIVSSPENAIVLGYAIYGAARDAE